MNRAIITKPRYGVIIAQIKQLFQLNKITTFPFQINQLLKNYNVKILRYSTLADRFSYTIDNIVDIIGSKDGKTFYIPKNELYMVTYNDTCLSEERYRWTLAHELGHIVLQHFQLFPHSSSAMGTGVIQLPAAESRLFEREADFFASELLCSPALLCQIPIKWQVDVSTAFKISNEAAKYAVARAIKNREFYKNRIDFYNNQFHDFIYSRYCIKCHHTFTIEKSKYCPICGSDNLKWKNQGLNICDFCTNALTNKESNNQASLINYFIYETLELYMKYHSYPEQENGKTQKCFRCDNEEIGDDDYCIICGLETQNKCSSYSCSETLSLNARYCPYCGEESTYYRLKLLPSWEDEYKEIQSELDPAQQFAAGSEDIPF